jgi:hypothetical protein
MDTLIFTDLELKDELEKRGAAVTGPFYFLDSYVLPYICRDREDGFSFKLPHYRALLEVEEDWDLQDLNGYWIRVPENRHSTIFISFGSDPILKHEIDLDPNDVPHPYSDLSSFEVPLYREIQTQVLFYLVMRYFCRQAFGQGDKSADIFKPFYYFEDDLPTYYSYHSFEVLSDEESKALEESLESAFKFVLLRDNGASCISWDVKAPPVNDFDTRDFQDIRCIQDIRKANLILRYFSNNVIGKNKINWGSFEFRVRNGYLLGYQGPMEPLY